MTWTKLPDGFNEDPVLLELPRGIRLLYVEALVYSNAHGTDGKLPRHVLSRVTDEPDPVAAAEQLVAAGVWDATDAGWSIAFDDQLPAKEVRERREATALRTKRWDHHRRGQHDLCRPGYCKQASASDAASGGASDDASDDALPSRPVPTRSGEGGTEEDVHGRWVAALPPAPPPASDEELMEFAASAIPHVKAAAQKALNKRHADRGNGVVVDKPVAVARPRPYRRAS